MHVLILTRNLPPLLGGMEQLNWHLADRLVRHAEVTVVGPRGAAEVAPAGVGVKEVSLSPLLLFLTAALFRALLCAVAIRPQLVLAGSGLTAPLAWIVARFVGARCAVYVHGLDLAVRHIAYRLCWLPVLRRMDCVMANSSATKELALAAGIAEGKISVVHPGVSPPNHNGSCSSQNFERIRPTGEEVVLLSVGRLTRRKGLREFVRDVFPLILNKAPHARLVVVGEVPEHALLKSLDRKEDILAAAQEPAVARRIEFLGPIRDRLRLSEIYRAADVHIFPVQLMSHDPEGFGMVAIEAAAHGLPTVAYAVGGVIDAVADNESGYLVTPGDAEAFAARIFNAIEDRKRLSESARGFARAFDWDAFEKAVIKVLSIN